MQANVNFIFILMTFSVNLDPSSTTSPILDLCPVSISVTPQCSYMQISPMDPWSTWSIPMQRPYKPPFPLEKPLALDNHFFVSVTVNGLL